MSDVSRVGTAAMAVATFVDDEDDVDVCCWSLDSDDDADIENLINYQLLLQSFTYEQLEIE